MKVVMLSIQPKWCEKIASGEKTVEVRKTRPKIETPFPCLIYCTLQGSKKFFAELQNQLGPYEALCKWNRENWGNKKGKVIGEFVCDKIEDFYCASVPYVVNNNLGYGEFIDNGVYNVQGNHDGIVFEKNDKYIDTMIKNAELANMCLSAQELFDYIGLGNHLYALHISDLVIYDKPKELGEFYHYCGDDPKCDGCKYLYSESNESVGFYEECFSPMEGCKPLSRTPQSWCYVEVQA